MIKKVKNTIKIKKIKKMEIILIQKLIKKCNMIKCNMIICNEINYNKIK